MPGARAIGSVPFNPEVPKVLKGSPRHASLRGTTYFECVCYNRAPWSSFLPDRQ